MMRRLGNNTLPPEGAPRCAVCVNFAWGGTKHGQHAVKCGGVWHHPSCTILRARIPSTVEPIRERSPTAIERMLLLFRPFGIVLFHVLGAIVVGLATVAACAWLTGCAALAKDTYENDLKQCAIDNRGKSDADYEACKRRVKGDWRIDAGAPNHGSE